MKNVVKVLRGELLLDTRVLEAFEALRDALQNDTSGREISSAVQRLEPLISELSKLEQEQERLLQENGKQDMREFLQAQPASVERDVALRLLQQVGEMQQAVRDASATSRSLLARSKEFIDYHINVFSEAQAGTTYGGSEAVMEGQRGMRLFDANA